MNKQKRKEFLHTIKITSTVSITQQWNSQAKIKNITAQSHNSFLMPRSNSLTHYGDPGFTLENEIYTNILQYLKSGKDIILYFSMLDI